MEIIGHATKAQYSYDIPHEGEDKRLCVASYSMVAIEMYNVLVFILRGHRPRFV